MMKPLRRLSTVARRMCACWNPGTSLEVLLSPRQRLVNTQIVTDIEDGNALHIQTKHRTYTSPLKSKLSESPPVQTYQNFRELALTARQKYTSNVSSDRPRYQRPGYLQPFPDGSDNRKGGRKDAARECATAQAGLGEEG